MRSHPELTRTWTDEIAEYIKCNGSFRQAEEWFNGIVEAIRTLGDMPGRCPVADESEDLGQEVRVCCMGGATASIRSTFQLSATGAVPARYAFFM